MAEAPIAKDIMQTKPITGSDKITVEEALKVLVENRITGFPIIDSKQHLVGVLSEYDLIVQLSKSINESPAAFKAPVNYTKSAITVQEDAPLSEVENILIEKKIRRLAVLNSEKRIVGMISRRDLMRHYFIRGKFTGV